MTRGGSIRVGIGGWVYPPWRGTFYPPDLPQRRELEYASRHLPSIEINGTFYGTQKPQSFARWRDETPEDFVFSLKGPRYATHRRNLAEAGDSIRRFLDSGVTALGDKLGPINWQFPPTRKFDADQFTAFLELLPRDHDGIALRHAVELRHETFRNRECIALARRHGVALVNAFEGKYAEIADITAPFVYVRLMATRERHPSGLAPRKLNLWARRARQWMQGKLPKGLEPVAEPAAIKAREVFLYLISGFKQHNPAAAMALIDRLA